MMKINATDLDQFANRREAQGLLPELIRRLIRVSAPRSARVSFPSGDSISRGGWDGIAHLPEETYTAPKGTSYWELTAQASKIERKATSYHKKRTSQTDAAQRASATFVFVSLHRWPGKAAWVTKTKSQKQWQDIRAYDADDIEDWLDNSPAVQLWFGWRMGLYPHDARSLDEYWETWRTATSPALTAEVVVAGRSIQQAKLAKYLKGAPCSLSVKGFSRDESISFIAAVIHQLEEGFRSETLSRAVIVSDSTSWRELIFCGSNLVLIPDFMPVEGLGRAVDVGHHVILPKDPSATGDPSAILLGNPSREELGAALQGLALSKSEAMQRVRASNGRLTALRRQLAVAPSAQPPHWSAPDEGISLIPLLLAGSWEGTDPDRLVIEQLTLRPYHQVVAQLTRLQNMSDPPLYRNGDSWQWNSRSDAWQLLSSYLTTEALERFEGVALDVLGEDDPSWELPPHEWGMAAVRGKVLSRSELLRKGVAETLALLGASEVESVRLPIALQDWAGRIVRQLLHDKRWQRWVSLASLFPLLAEAAPLIFLGAVEDILSEQEVLDRMFLEGGMLGPHSAHTGLLWALESCAWHPQYLTRVTLILGTLARLDPKGRLANRPGNSLQEIFCVWCPQTKAPLQQRLTALDTLYQREPEIGWQLFVALLPTGGGSTSFPTHQPLWRDWGAEWPPQRDVADYPDHIHRIASRVLELVHDDRKRWLQLLKSLSILSSEHRTRVIVGLQEYCERELEEDERLELREALRKILSHHRSFPDTDWALDATTLDHLESVYRQLIPLDPKDRYGWLFSYHPDSPDGDRGDWREQESIVEAERQSAMEALLAEHGVEFFLDFSESVDSSDLVGRTLGKATLTCDFTQRLIDSTIEGTPALQQLLGGLVASLLQAQGWEWVHEELQRLRGHASEAGRVTFLCALPFDRHTWEIARDEDLHDLYWRQARAGYTPDRAEYTEQAVQELIRAERAWAAVGLAGMHLEPKKRQALPAPVLVEVLTASSQQTRPQDERPPVHMTSLDYHVGKILDYLEETGEVETTWLAQLEFRFFYFLQHRRKPRLLYKELSRSPKMFAEIISWIYKPRNRDKSEGEEPSEERARLGSLGYELLHEWNRIPGTDEEGEIDRDQLAQWIESARSLCSSIDRAKVGDIHIGQILAHAPADVDGIWPATPIRDVIEDLASRDIESGFSIQIQNNRGATSRAIGEGGGQEYELAQRYQDNADALRETWPRTAAILDDVAASYWRFGRKWDMDAERERQ